ncbi:DUF4153 domain-containing protein [Pigmentiphaga aceris]|uniref:DUF4153 domain-containing protein n=1 Tax=Pigmentiphaga aceris TaxID=1940612 RepID=A0A5C0AWS9_9BURK|nr:DUF4153 domain-containing protein [Pigmentiphaga aceris]QEI06778.1 DUF4153 domain-containing protein [Pigmentiphaga aceris]
MSNTMRRLAIVGLIQGAALLAIYLASINKGWLSTQAPLLLALIYTSFALPAAWYLTEDIDGLPPRRRLVGVLSLGLILALLGACEGWAGADADGTALPDISTVACIVLGFVGVPLFAHAERSNGFGWRWNYAALFQSAWRNAMMLMVAFLLTGIMWGVLLAGSALMSSIGINIVRDLLMRPWFWIPVCTTTFACAMALTLARADTMIALRRFWLSMNQAFLVLMLLFSTMWAVALVFTGIDPLLKTRVAGFALLWFAALSVKFVNAAYQDGTHAPFSPWLRRPLSLAWLTIPVVTTVAGVAIYQRIAQYGWTGERVWSVFILIMATGYALGYSLSAFAPKRGWMWSIGQTNVVMALVLCAGLIALSSPIADARRVSVDSQVGRLLAGKTPVDKFDFRYLDEKSGIYGRKAFAELKAGVPGHPQAAAFTKAAEEYERKKNLWRTDSKAPPTDDELRANWTLLPEGTQPQPALVDTLLAQLRDQKLKNNKASACLEARNLCTLWLGDLDGDKTPELMVVIDQTWRQTAVIYRWQAEGAQLARVATIEELTEEWVKALRRGESKLVPNPWLDIEAGGQRVQIKPEN